MYALRRAESALALLVPLFASVACHNGSSGGSAGNTGGLTPLLNVGVNVTSALGDGRLLLLRVWELREGNADLDDDGDARDFVAWTYDLDLHQLRNLGLAFGAVPDALELAHGELAFFAVSEREQGQTDLNGDGDALDLVAHVFDLRTGVVTNLGLALGAEPPLIADDFVAFTVREADQGAVDLDGDGQTTSDVLHVYDARTGQTHDVGRNVTGTLVHHDGRFAFTTDERARGDLNGDGDVSDDFVPEFYDPTQQTLATVPVALLRGSLFAADGPGAWIALLDEAGQRDDLNQDGDLDDGVYVRIDPELAQWTSLRLSGRGPEVSPYVRTLTAPGRVALIASESDGIDHNHNGFLGDLRLVIHDLDTGINMETGLQVNPFFGDSALKLGGSTVAMQVDEGVQGEDLDGDGIEASQRVVELVDLATGAVKNLRLDSLDLSASEAGVVFSREERDGDLNGDGDRNESVLFVMPAGAAGPINTKITGTVLDMQGGFALLSAFEFQSHADWDHDGDELDNLLLRCPLLDGGITPFAPWSPFAQDQIRFGEAGTILYFADESQLAQDLNHDGDELDLVFELSPTLPVITAGS